MSHVSSQVSHQTSASPKRERKMEKPASANLGASGISTPNSGIALRNSVALAVSSDGYCVLDFAATVVGDHDFVGVYANASQPQGDNLGGNSGWEWCMDSPSDFPYTTSVAAEQGYVGIYWSYDYLNSVYVAVAITPSLPADPRFGTPSQTGSST